MRGKIYTIEELNRALPLLRAIVDDIVDGSRRLRKELVALGFDDASRSLDDRGILSELPWDTRDLVEELRAHVEELGELGIFLRDPEVGLVEAYGFHDDEIVYLSWQPGEEEVSFWHGLFASPRERRAVRPASLSGTA